MTIFSFNNIFLQHKNYFVHEDAYTINMSWARDNDLYNINTSLEIKDI